MIYLEEITNWGDNKVQNHVYILNDSMSKMIAYIPRGTNKVIKFSKPMGFDRKDREFVEIGKSDSTVETITGSKGQKYYLSNPGNRWVCTCPGFKYYGKCKHVDSKQV